MPALLEYFSYLFHYSTVLAGPVCTFKEFNDFIDGSDVRPKVINLCSWRDSPLNLEKEPTLK